VASIDVLNCITIEALVGTLPFDGMLVVTTLGTVTSGVAPVVNEELKVTG
jgi:hypothetical protein